MHDEGLSETNTRSLLGLDKDGSAAFGAESDLTAEQQSMPIRDGVLNGCGRPMARSGWPIDWKDQCHGLIGLSTVSGAFTDPSFAGVREIPACRLFLPLSNSDRKSEENPISYSALAEDGLSWRRVPFSPLSHTADARSHPRHVQ